MPEDFESYFTYQHKTLGLAYRLVPRSAGNWAFMNPTQDLRFICERQTVQCRNLTGKTNKLPHNLATHHTMQKRDSKFTGAVKAGTPKFSRLQHGNKSYVLYHETVSKTIYVSIVPLPHAGQLFSFAWKLFDCSRDGRLVQEYSLSATQARTAAWHNYSLSLDLLLVSFDKPMDITFYNRFTRTTTWTFAWATTGRRLLWTRRKREHRFGRKYLPWFLTMDLMSP